MVTFTSDQIATFDAQEREMFNALVTKANAKVEAENGGFDVKAYLAKRNAFEAEEEKCRQELERSLI